MKITLLGFTLKNLIHLYKLFYYFESHFLLHPTCTLSAFEANKWILEVVQIHLCQVVLVLCLSNKGPDGIIQQKQVYDLKQQEWRCGHRRGQYYKACSQYRTV